MLPGDLTDLIERPAVQNASLTRVAAEPDLDSLMGLPLAEAERLIVMATLARFDGSVPKAARSLDVSPSTLYRKLQGWAESAPPG
jgi:DNA-binding NtrC family response regulator